MSATTSTVPSVPYASPSLYVGDLDQSVTEALLFEIFNAVGPVASVRVCRDAATRRSLGYAYVNFHRIEDAERALDTLNFKPIKNRACRIMWSHRDPSLRKSGVGNIFVNHLAKTIDNKQLYDTFSVFGNILSCKVSCSRAGESLGYGFVHYETEESAKLAIEKVDGKMIANQTVSVQPFKSKKERGTDQQKFTNVFVKNLPAEYTKEAMETLFSTCGKITSALWNIDQSQQPATRSYGFINFETAEEAQQAVNTLNDSDVDGRKIYVGRAQRKEERERELREKFEQNKAEKQKKYAGVNLYVKNVTDDFDDEKLTNEFSKFGSITSAKIMRDQNNNSRGFGFVCFSSAEEATKAVTEMNNKMINGKPLYVALHQRKEQRRALLEQQYQQRQKAMQVPAQMYPQAPMMFQPGMPPRNFMYPQSLPGRFGPVPVGAVPAGMAPAMPRQFRPMPANGIPAMRPYPQSMPLQPLNGAVPVQGGQGMRRQNNRRPMNAQGPKGAAGPMPTVNVAGQTFKYQQNVRNMPGQAVPATVAPAAEEGASDASAPAAPAAGGLSLQALASAPEEMRKQMIGERLFPLIQVQQPALAGKITGMLLEMDDGELLHLLESPQALSEKVNEALQVLEMHTQQPEDGSAPVETDAKAQ